MMTEETSLPKSISGYYPRGDHRLAPERLTVPPDQSFVVMLIGMRINRWWALPIIVGVAAAMGRMLRELQADPNSGLLHVEGRGPGLSVQYWRSIDDLLDYAKSKNHEHAPAWRRWIKDWATGAVGIWHETYIVEPGSYESVYHHMPAKGLGKVFERIPAQGPLNTSRGRLREGMAARQRFVEEPEAAKRG